VTWTAFVTGCASGFGRAIARRLLSHGHRVVATAPHAGAWMEEIGAPGASYLPMVFDVRDDQAVREAVSRALAWGPIDLLVNNAGKGYFATQEEGDPEAFRDLLDVNVVGPARLTRALLPSLRDRKGIVVQISSVAGQSVFPESGFYAATKHALEAMSEALAQEVGPFGVRVRVIEPGQFATRFQESAAAISPSPGEDSPYAALRTEWKTLRLGVLESPQDPELVADAVIASLADPAPHLWIPVGPDSEQILRRRRALGAAAFGKAPSR
jgi:NAD(P)-dependent dehydrogenase (short-subunit alcohol dehydrogenase family)